MISPVTRGRTARNESGTLGLTCDHDFFYLLFFFTFSPRLSYYFHVCLFILVSVLTKLYSSLSDSPSDLSFRSSSRYFRGAGGIPCVFFIDSYQPRSNQIVKGSPIHLSDSKLMAAALLFATSHSTLFLCRSIASPPI